MYRYVLNSTNTDISTPLSTHKIVCHKLAAATYENSSQQQTERAVANCIRVPVLVWLLASAVHL